jgi:hypothetical protein
VEKATGRDNDVRGPIAQRRPRPPPSQEEIKKRNGPAMNLRAKRPRQENRLETGIYDNAMYFEDEDDAYDAEFDDYVRSENGSDDE